MDLYQLTADPKYLAAVDGFYAMFREHWLHVGGTVAIKEWKLYPPGSYFLDTWVSHLLLTYRVLVHILCMLVHCFSTCSCHFSRSQAPDLHD